jgi:hypothetical protein
MRANAACSISTFEGTGLQEHSVKIQIEGKLWNFANTFLALKDITVSLLGKNHIASTSQRLLPPFSLNRLLDAADKCIKDTA